MTLARADLLQRRLQAIPYARLLGLECEVDTDGHVAMRLPVREPLMGNVALPALHGGAIGSFLEFTAMAEVFLHMESEALPLTIDVTVDYLRSAGAADLHARARITRMGRRIANVEAHAWQADPDTPVASLHGHFLVAR
jgi:uncharacterized protein (TIGR00369 family)